VVDESGDGGGVCGDGGAGAEREGGDGRVVDEAVVREVGGGIETEYTSIFTWSLRKFWWVVIYCLAR